MKANRYNEFRWLASQVRPFVRLHFASYACILAASILVLIDPLIVRFLIDDVIPNRRLRLLPLVGFAFFLAYMGRLGFDSLAGLLNFQAVQKMTFRSRLSLLRHLQRLSAEYHDDKPVGDTLHRLQIDVDQVGSLSSEVIPSGLRTITVFCLIMTAMVVLNYRLTAIVLPLVPVFVLVRRRFHTRLTQASDSVQQQSAKVIQFLEEHLSSIVQVQLLSCEQREARRFARLSGHAVRAQVKRRATELFFSSLLYLLIVLGMASVLSYGGYQVITGTLTAGSLIAFYGYTLQLFVPLYGVVDIYSKFQRAGASVRRLMEISEADVILRDHPGALVLEPGVIELNDVSFSYRADRPVLEALSMRVNPGERVALAGTSGNGKSTIARLLARLYDARSGTVSINGTDVRDIKLKSLRSSVIFVPQDPVLFDLTLRENLLYGNSGATATELTEVARLAQLETVIERLPNGWNEPLGPRGNRLSGGERQRVALARALLQRPRILILDECTSALDATTEKQLLTELDRHLKTTTTIIISHRPLPVQWADRVVHMQYGAIVDHSPETLINS
ncbi:MAG TPA: ABC transporter ATP-binding protein [Pyrinomonadaceae bacterium]|jgi:subfamily B ATP-binding cassette protein MsbA|nr:ABC transporter ATP-binding protein [Pyrinomonadaceae bacterium]